VSTVPEAVAAPPPYAYVLGDALYLNLTSSCTLACVFCPKIRDGNWVVGGYDLKLAHDYCAHVPPWPAAQAVTIIDRLAIVCLQRPQ